MPEMTYDSAIAALDLTPAQVSYLELLRERREDIKRADDERQILADAAEERRIAKEKMLARNAERVTALTTAGELKEGETLEQYDNRKAAEASDGSQ
jgi:hypothetical protein